MDNYQKNEKYKYLMEKLAKAVKNEFYYEAIFIEYAVIEDRTESLLRHAKLNTLDKNNRGLLLNAKLRKIENNKVFHSEYIKKHITSDLLSRIHVWKNERNSLIHSLVNSNYGDEKIKEIALRGYDIVKTLNNKSTLVNKHLDKKEKISS